MKHRAEFLMITAAMGFALGGVAAKVLREADMDAFRLTQIRSTGAAIILIAFAVMKGKSQLYARKDELTKRGDLVRAGGAPYLHTLISSVPTAANAGYYAKIIRERAIMRRLVEAGTKIVQLGFTFVN